MLNQIALRGRSRLFVEGVEGGGGGGGGGVSLRAGILAHLHSYFPELRGF